MYQQIMYYCKTNAKIIRDKSDYMYMKSNFGECGQAEGGSSLLSYYDIILGPILQMNFDFSFPPSPCLPGVKVQEVTYQEECQEI